MRPAAATVATGLIGEAGHLFCEMARLLLCDRNDHHKGACELRPETWTE